MSDSHRLWKWTRRFAVGLTISVAAFSAWGALAPHIPTAPWIAALAAGALMAALYGNSQGLANCMAANARRAWERGKGFRLPAAFFTLCFIGFALLSMSGLHSAWEFVKVNSGGAPLPRDDLMSALFLFVAFSEPAMNYGVEALKTMQAVDERAEEREMRDAAAEREIRQQDADARRRALHLVAAPASAMALAMAPAAEAAGPATEFPFEPVSHSVPAHAEAHSHAAHGWRGPRDPRRWERFVEAHELGLPPAAIIRETGLPSTTVYRWRSRLKLPATG
ncbi:MAG: hypothetical protein AB7J28_01695 [Hyphomonadaceae bacterium]